MVSLDCKSLKVEENLNIASPAFQFFSKRIVVDSY